MRKLTRANKKSNNSQTYYQNLHCINKWCNLQAEKERDTKNIPVVYYLHIALIWIIGKNERGTAKIIKSWGGGEKSEDGTTSLQHTLWVLQQTWFLWPHKSSDLWPRHAKTHRETDTSVHLRFFRQGALFDELKWVGDDGMFWCNGLFRHDVESWKRDAQNTDINSFVWHTRGKLQYKQALSIPTPKWLMSH